MSSGQILFIQRVHDNFVKFFLDQNNPCVEAIFTLYCTHELRTVCKGAYIDEKHTQSITD